MNISEVKEEAWIAEDAYGVSETSYKWAESGYAHASALYLDANFEEAFKIDDVSSVFHYDSIAKLERLTSNITEHDDKCRVSNGLLCEDEIATLTLAVCFPKSSEDRILDIHFAKKVPELDFKFCDDELSFGNPRSALNSPETSNEVVGVSEFSNRPPKCLRDTASEMHDVTGNKYIDGTVIEDGTILNRTEDRSMNCSTVCGKQHSEKAINEHYSPCDEVNRVNHLMEAEDVPAHGPCGLVTSRQKRLSRPPKKYAEESPKSKPRRGRGRPKKFPTSSSHSKYLSAVSNQKKFPATSERETRKVSRRNLELDTDDDYTPNVSHFRSKNNTPWKLDEVVKLVDGIAQHGQGQWTAIQRTFFTSKCRSPTDIRDKWRNLVKANCGKRKKKRKDQHLRNGLLVLPDTIIERIKELDKAIPNCRSEQEGELSDSKCYETNLCLPD